MLYSCSVLKACLCTVRKVCMTLAAFHRQRGRGTKNMARLNLRTTDLELRVCPRHLVPAESFLQKYFLACCAQKIWTDTTSSANLLHHTAHSSTFAHAATDHSCHLSSAGLPETSTGHQNLSQGVLLVTPPFSIPAGSALLLCLLIIIRLQALQHNQIRRAIMEPKSNSRSAPRSSDACSTLSTTTASLFTGRAHLFNRTCDSVQFA